MTTPLHSQGERSAANRRSTAKPIASELDEQQRKLLVLEAQPGRHARDEPQALVAAPKYSRDDEQDHDPDEHVERRRGE